jgi:rhodanese-related sulfurtransferase
MKTKSLFVLTLALLTLPCLHAADKVPTAPASAAATAKPKRVEVEEFDKLRQNKANVLIDVRTEKEFKAGHIPGAINIDVRSPDFAEKTAKLDKSKTYLVNCAAGGRSATACGKLAQEGFTNLFDLAPGFKGWEKAGKPVEK